MPHPSDESVEACGGSSGIFSWLDRHREKRRREHLKLEAEKQLQKIGEAQRAAHRESLNSSAKSKSKRTAKAKNVNANISPTSSDKLDINRDQSLVDSISSSSSVASAAAAASSGGGSAASRSTEGRQQQYLTEPSHSFGHSDVSKSGEGASGMLSLSDIDGLCPDPNLSSSNSKPTLGDAPKAAANPPAPVEEEEEEDLVGPVRVTPTEGDDASPYILSQTQMNEISKHVLPETITYCRWRRLYGLGRDGDSFDGCLRIIGSEKRTLMVVRTTKGDIFGGYADAPWHSRHDSSTAKFYGSASSCLYSFSSTLQPYSTSSSPESSPLNVYRWTGKNRYIQVCDVSNKMLAFGGGGDKGAFGLCLQEDFTRGTTGHCDTFDNDPLCSGDERTFDICDLEFWEFQTGVF